MSDTACPWDGLAPGTVSFCEERLCAWIAEPANSWSALGYVFVGVWLFATHARRSGDPRLYMACVAEVLIGLGSIAFHGTGSFAGEFLDLVGMFLLSALILAYAIGKVRGLSSVRTAQLYVGLVVASAALMLIIRPIGIALFCLQLTLGVTAELMWWRRSLGAERVNYRRLFQGMAIFGVSFTIWALDITRVVCDPQLHLIQGHAVWHVLNALCVERLYRFYAAQPTGGAPPPSFCFAASAAHRTADRAGAAGSSGLRCVELSGAAMLGAVRKLVVVVAVAFFACSRPDASGAVSTSHALEAAGDRHLLLTVELTSSGVTLIQSTLVEQPLPRLRHPEPHPWSVEVIDARGSSLFQTRIAAQNQVRGEFEDDGKMSGTHLLVDRAVFQIRAPAARGAVILRAQRSSLSPNDPRREGAGEEVELGRFELP